MSSVKPKRPVLSNRCRPWQAFLVVLYAFVIIGGLSHVHQLPNGKPSHPHSTDSECAELSECQSEVKAEIAFFATTPDLVTPYIEVPSARLDILPTPIISDRVTTTCLLRGPPAA
ncbi:hypothetical protein C5Y96_22835 [Blastopirellula marina]|uniref:Uncharacterized protein n=1 Tax=Blastopirellula marina TaxID=124 RepID=A0A2S8F0J6_9BACT|nr:MULTISPECIES: hypothetical protein [Pirellulaceae]PQO25660.1 hypothetical protein C5Y96_22835 [Blastopirellula marina]RCS43343.1 hypothetical protein DTL36_22885 [Bremerella cremea]